MIIKYILQQLKHYNLPLYLDGIKYNPNLYGWVKDSTTDEDITVKQFVTQVEMIEHIEQYRKRHQLSDSGLLVSITTENADITPKQITITYNDVNRIIIRKVQQTISIVSMSPNNFSTSYYYMSDYATWVDHILLLMLFRKNHPESFDNA